jgi:RNase P/RNase MRP subunit POP5
MFTLFFREMERIIKATRRHRYIRFRITALGHHHPFTTAELLQELRQKTKELFFKETKELGLWLIRFDGTTGILKCSSTEKEHVIHLLQSIQRIGLTHVTCTTQMTSGTIHGLSNHKLDTLE